MIAHGSLPHMPSFGLSCNTPQTLPLREEGTRDEAQRTSAWVATQHGRFGCNREKLDVIFLHYPVDSTRFSWPNHNYIARMTVIHWNPDFLTTLGKADYGSNYCGSPIGFFNPVIPRVIFDFWHPTSSAYFPSRISPRFRFKIPNPEPQIREIRHPEKIIGDPHYWEVSKIEGKITGLYI